MCLFILRYSLRLIFTNWPVSLFLPPPTLSSLSPPLATISPLFPTLLLHGSLLPVATFYLNKHPFLPPFTRALCFTSLLPLCSLFKLSCWYSQGRRDIFLHLLNSCSTLTPFSGGNVSENSFFCGFALSSAALEISLSLTYDSPISSLFQELLN